ncbi:MAG: hypothetical protein G8237_13780 [Magnetococcales bacterium]|nr:hypothetical protein [Magnetococcales bacterium]NGZ07415.1 hypothetical protein [Magnetococcales bacterium]
MHKPNCWDFFQCMRSRHGARMEGTPCPVSLMSSYQGCNGGVAAGRACWMIEGTFCTVSKCGVDDERGGYEFKKDHCDHCEFKALVKEQEGKGFHEERRSMLLKR